MNILQLILTRRAAKKIIKKIDSLPQPMTNDNKYKTLSPANKQYLLDIGMNMKSDNYYDERWFVRNTEIMRKSTIDNSDLNQRHVYIQAHGPIIISSADALKRELTQRFNLK